MLEKRHTVERPMSPRVCARHKRSQGCRKRLDLFSCCVGDNRRVPAFKARRIVGDNDERDIATSVDRVVDGMSARRQPNMDGVGCEFRRQVARWRDAAESRLADRGQVGRATADMWAQP